MKHSQRDTVHRVRAVRSWLEKAEASFDKESDIKGELNLMLAEAEMKNLRKHHPVSKGWLRTGAVITALFLVLGGWYGFHLYGQGATPPVMGTATPAPAAGKESGQDSAAKAAPATEPVPAEVVRPPAQQAIPAPPVEPAAPAIPDRDEPTVQPAATAVTEPKPPAPAPVRTETKAVLSDRQVQATVQEARHTLRGTSTTK
ncbi:hypothetical protein [Megasphaera elsdenii]|uniref:hypothetical protein n=1 Tax=Megasphaera elsdenii TaxID=907 RepID=UPI00242E7063|nr:hypothetical protein [Megasphaera elsdenii]